MVIINGISELITNNFTGVTYNIYKIFKKNNKTHRYYGPAVIYNDGAKAWWFNGGAYGYSIHGDYNKEYNQKLFLKDLNKLWLL